MDFPVDFHRKERAMRTTHRPGRTRRILYRMAVPVLATLAVAACSSGGSTNIGNGGAVAGQKEQGGTVTEGWVGGVAPNFIFPYAPATNTDGYNGNLTEPLWPELVYEGEGGQATIDWAQSVAKSITYSDNDTAVAITLQNWKWSDGTPITSRDLTFTYNLMKANYANWSNYLPDGFPEDVTSATTDGPHTVIFHLNRSYNPAYYTEDVLALVQLIPQHAWDKTSVNGTVGNYDETASGAKAVYSFLQTQGANQATFLTNPLWKVVDGPWTLSYYNTNGDYYYVPNKNYSGAVKATVAHYDNVSYTTDAAELDSIRAGGSVQVGTLPLNDTGQVKILESEGYSVAAVGTNGVAEIIPNFYPSSGATGVLLQQLYIRQALEYLINRTQIVNKIYDGYADPGNGPVPVNVFGSVATSLEKSGGPYPYDPSKATALLKAHGWSVTSSGTDVCQSATLCGSGISKGTKLEFTLLYSSGQATTDEENAAIQSSEAQAGITINLKSEPFNTIEGEIGLCSASTHPSSACDWQLVEFGYDEYQMYPDGNSMFNTGGNNDNGGYSDATENALIGETEYGSSASAFAEYENYTAQQLPYLWLPLQDVVFVYKSDLAGVAPANSFSAGTNAQDWYYVKQSK
jgi:peptide/nickel transport system substrate-binding protein